MLINKLILNLDTLINLQENAIVIYLRHFEAMIERLLIDKNDKIEIQKTFNDIFNEKREIIDKLKKIKQQITKKDN